VAAGAEAAAELMLPKLKLGPELAAGARLPLPVGSANVNPPLLPVLKLKPGADVSFLLLSLLGTGDLAGDLGVVDAGSAEATGAAAVERAGDPSAGVLSAAGAAAGAAADAAGTAAAGGVEAEAAGAAGLLFSSSSSLSLVSSLIAAPAATVPAAAAGLASAPALLGLRIATGLSRPAEPATPAVVCADEAALAGSFGDAGTESSS